MKIIGAYDGDVNLKKQQEAYLASKTAEESRVYQYYLRRKVSVDIMFRAVRTDLNVNMQKR